MDNIHPRVLELIVSKVCHDLVSPVGAIGNGVELMEELGGSAGNEALSLISSSATQAARRLKCFRLAYGAAGTDKNIGFKDIKEAFEGWLLASAGENIKVSFAEDLALRFSMPPKGFLKTTLNLLMLAAECAHGSGEIKVSVVEGSQGVAIEVKGNRVKFRDNADKALAGDFDIEELDARTSHPYMTGRFSDYFGFKLSSNMEDNDSGLTIKLEF